MRSRANHSSLDLEDPHAGATSAGKPVRRSWSLPVPLGATIKKLMFLLVGATVLSVFLWGDAHPMSRRRLVEAQCPECLKIFTSQDGFFDHLVTHGIRLEVVSDVDTAEAIPGFALFYKKLEKQRDDYSAAVEVQLGLKAVLKTVKNKRIKVLYNKHNEMCGIVAFIVNDSGFGVETLMAYPFGLGYRDILMREVKFSLETSQASTITVQSLSHHSNEFYGRHGFGKHKETRMVCGKKVEHFEGDNIVFWPPTDNSEFVLCNTKIGKCICHWCEAKKSVFKYRTVVDISRLLTKSYTKVKEQNIVLSKNEMRVLRNLRNRIRLGSKDFPDVNEITEMIELVRNWMQHKIDPNLETDKETPFNKVLGDLHKHLIGMRKEVQTFMKIVNDK